MRVETRLIGHCLPARSLLLLLCMNDRVPGESIADAFDEVLESARDVATRGVALARLEAGDAVAQGLQAGALVLFAASFAGFVAAIFWWSAVGAVAWWVGLHFGAIAAASWVAGAHGVLVAAVWAFGRSRLGPDEEPSS